MPLDRSWERRLSCEPRKHRPGALAPDGGENLAFYAALGFISGFSERFAQDVIAQASRGLRSPNLRNLTARLDRLALKEPFPTVFAAV
jgi:hypothetical protein